MLTHEQLSIDALMDVSYDDDNEVLGNRGYNIHNEDWNDLNEIPIFFQIKDDPEQEKFHPVDEIISEEHWEDDMLIQEEKERVYYPTWIYDDSPYLTEASWLKEKITVTPEYRALPFIDSLKGYEGELCYAPLSKVGEYWEREIVGQEPITEPEACQVDQQARNFCELPDLTYQKLFEEVVFWDWRAERERRCEFLLEWVELAETIELLRWGWNKFWRRYCTSTKRCGEADDWREVWLTKAQKSQIVAAFNARGIYKKGDPRNIDKA